MPYSNTSVPTEKSVNVLAVIARVVADATADLREELTPLSPEELEIVQSIVASARTLTGEERRSSRVQALRLVDVLLLSVSVDAVERRGAETTS
jgi:hypothetical protein